MAEQLPRGLLADPMMAQSLASLLATPALDRATLLPVGRRTFTDPGDDITEERSLEFALPGLLYDPLMGAAKVSDMFAGVAPIDPGAMTQFMIDAPVVGGLLGAATGAVPRGAVLGANVFHGGPHRFAPEPDFPHGRPRLDKIGTGEGAQAYGYGFYSADAPGVAKQYKQDLSGFDELVLTTSKGKLRGEALDDVDLEVSKYLELGEKDAGQFKHNTVYYAKKLAEKAGRDDVLKRLDEYGPDARKSYEKNVGTLYKLDIPDADVAKYLDWDKPLSEQPKSVEDALRRMANDIAETGDYDRFEHLALAATRGEHPRGGSTKTITGGELYTDLTSFGRGDTSQQASMKLKDYGIPGLKYFDADSRGVPKADRTRNYVTWDQDVLDRSKMLERDGVTLGANKAPTAALPGLLDDTASRMQRARDMGFDVDAYHGTDAAVTEFMPLAKGRSTKAKSAKKAYWFSDDPETASGYADAATDSKVQSLIDQSYAAERKGDFDSAEKLMADAETLEQGTSLRGQNIIPAKLRGKLKTVDMEGAKYDPDDISLSKILADAESEGFEGVAFKNFSDEAGYGRYNPTTHYAVFDPKNIRSRFAKFDPAKADSADLLAANPATAALPSLLQDRSGNIDQRGLMSRTPRNRNSFPMYSLLGQRLYTATMPDGSI